MDEDENYLMDNTAFPRLTGVILDRLMYCAPFHFDERSRNVVLHPLSCVLYEIYISAS